MLRFHLLRHGKAPFEAVSSDVERRLDSIGKEQVSSSIQNSVNLNSIDHIVSSTANRAYESAHITCQHLNYPLEAIEPVASIYNATLSHLLSLVLELPNEKKDVLFVGHNPGFSELASYLSGEYIGMGTGSLVSFEFDFEEWELITQGSGRRLF